MKSMVYKTKRTINLFWTLFFIALPIINFVPDLQHLRVYTIPILVFYTAVKIVKKITKAIFFTTISVAIIYLFNSIL